MLALKRAPLALALALLAAALILPASGGASTADGSSALAAKKGKAKKKCPKGKALKTVRKNGKKVKKCLKRKAPKGSGPKPTPKGLFEAPGQVLEGEAAKPFLQRYLANSTFTDCVPGWPNCAVEQRYSHSASGTFHYCRLTSVSGADIRVTDEYGIEGVRVEPDGSWAFREVVANSGNYSRYEWKVSATGVVNGAYQFTPSSQVEQIGPLQYVGGVAKDCSY